MQFCQPTGFPLPGFLNYGQPCAFASPPQFNGYPDIIGEGNVTSIISPDGSTQFIFTPTCQWLRTSAPNPTTGNYNNLGVWMVRSIYNPLQPTVFSQPTPYGLPCPRPAISDCYLNLPAPNCPLRFHNDNCTSTSDIHYFIPKQFNWFQYPSKCAGVQVENPFATTTVRHHDVACTKPCNCAPIEPCCCATKHREKVHNIVRKSSNSAMSIEESKSDSSCHKKRGKKSRKLKKTKSKKSVAKCECITSDKSVTTYADQATDCTPEKGQETQTFCTNNTCTVREVRSGDLAEQHVKTEIWKPKSPVSKKNMAATSSIAVRRSWVSTSCSCDSETEMD